MATKLEQAVEIYKSLGYEDVSLEETLTLGIGTKEQQKIAKEGLKSGNWLEFKQLSENSYGMVPVVDVDLEKLAIFAIKVGVDARRATQILRDNNEINFLAIKNRGDRFASDFIEVSCNAKRRSFEHSSSMFGMLCVNLVHRLNLTIPNSVEYIKDWAVYAGNALNILKEGRNYDKNFAPTLDEIKSRFNQHIELGVSLNAPATGPFSDVLLEGVKQKLIPREKAKELMFFALDLSVRPGDRKAWMSNLEQIGLNDDDIIKQGESLIPLLALGDTSVIERFAPVLIEYCTDENLPSILISSSSTNVKKIKQLILKSALNRPKPTQNDDVRDWVKLYINDEDKTISNLAQKLAKAWKINFDTTQNTNTEVKIKGLWQKTPKLWQVPKFDIGEVSPENLTKLTAELSNRKVNVADIVSEKFIAMANILAYKNPTDAKLSLAGLKPNDFSSAPYILGLWAKNKELLTEIDPIRKRYRNGKEILQKEYFDLIRARDYVICTNIDKIPCILSTPSYNDLSITVSDLTQRLAKYREEKFTYVFEPDLQLALTRLDINSYTETDLKKLKDVKIFVQLPDGEKIKDEKNNFILVGEVIINYIHDPFIEKKLDTKRKYFWSIEMDLPKSLSIFPNRFGYNSGDLFSIFPSWGDYALTCVRRDTEVYHGQGMAIKQVARRKEPFTSGALMNLLASQSYLSDENAQDVIYATKKAWERGLLIPNTADVKSLDWIGGDISNLASLAVSLDNIAGDGILSVVWQTADDLITESLNAPRMVTGTADIAKIIQKYLDEVIFAVEKGIAPIESLELKGIRRLAQKSGSSLAVTVAKDVVSKLDSLNLENSKATEKLSKKDKKDKTVKSNQKSDSSAIEPFIPNIPFDEIWKVATPKPIIQDNVSIRVETLETTRSFKPLVFNLTLPEKKDVEYKVIMDGWMYGIDNEGQTHALESPPNTPYSTEGKSRVWLYWDEKKKKMTTSKLRNWRGNTDGPLEGMPAPLSSAMITMIIGLLAQDGDAIYSAPRTVQRLVETGEIGVDILRQATKTLLQNEDVSPAKLVRVLEKNPNLLPVFWVMLTECVRFAGEKTISDSRPPTWINRVLDICIYHAYYLKTAVDKKLIMQEDSKWTGLEEIANCKAKSTAVQKAKTFSKMIFEN